ncbi:unnamed protein product [Plutella xylostella]|uniref:(diamondback moth) hypothetical protein n=1 Tax=Plutella xylostella TaxID=51655 RepID=A0A8S4D9I6_PLUXY|nr:unnamed protein product [Plutella xylostella]
MAICDRWVALKIVEFLLCVACVAARRVSSDDEARLALLLQKLSREWSLLNSVTWDSVGGSFADAVYGGYVIITFGLLLGRIFQEVPKGRRILEGFLLGCGLLFFLVLGGLALASLDSVPHTLVTNATVLGTLSLIVAALFLLDLMSPRVYTAARPTQTEATETVSPIVGKKVSIANPPNTNGHLPNDPAAKTNGHLPNGHANGHLPSDKKDADDKTKEDKITQKEETTLFDAPKHYPKFDDSPTDDLGKSKFGSLRDGMEGGNYIRLSDPMAPDRYDRLHYEHELAKFNEKYFRDYLDSVDGRFNVKEDYLPEPQLPLFSKVRSPRLKSLYEDVSPTYEQKRASKSPSRVRTVSTPTLQQLEDYLKGSNRNNRRADTPALFPMEPIAERADGLDGRASGTPTDPGFVQYSADKWPDKRDIRTPRHSPTH